MRKYSDIDPSKKYICSKCPKRFDFKFNYQRHMKTHSDKPEKFGCHLCPKYFTAKYNLNRHIIKFH
ncbi:hypothetical protein CLU79DRAFT_782738, partial [Phycomyces nitens]